MAVKVTLFQIQMKRNTTLFIPFDERRRSCTFLIEKNKYYLRVFDNNGILNLKADEFGENLNLTLDDELKLHKEYPYEGKTTINIIFSDLKEIDKVIQGKLLIK